MSGHEQLAHLVAQAVAAVRHADDDEFLLRCAVVAAHHPDDVLRALQAHRAAPVGVATTGERPEQVTVIRELEAHRVPATERYLDTGEVGAADPIDRIVDAILLLAAEQGTAG